MPPEINDIIDSYLYEPLILKFQIVFPDEYPFRSSIWFLTKVISKKEINKNMIIYYSDKVKQYNKLEWHPAMGIEKDILLFLSYIIDFKSVIF